MAQEGLRRRFDLKLRMDKIRLLVKGPIQLLLNLFFNLSHHVRNKLNLLMRSGLTLLLSSQESLQLFAEAWVENGLDFDVDTFHLLPTSVPSTSLHKSVASIDFDAEDLSRVQSIIGDFIFACLAPMPVCRPLRHIKVVLALGIVNDGRLVGRSEIVSAFQDSCAAPHRKV